MCRLIYLCGYRKTLFPWVSQDCVVVRKQKLAMAQCFPVVNGVFIFLSANPLSHDRPARHHKSSISVLLAWYAWIIFPVLVCSTARERENYSLTISCCPQSAFCCLELAYNGVKTLVACVIIYWALSSWRTHERKNIVQPGSNSLGFSQKLLGQVFIGLFDFQILFPPLFPHSEP